MGEAIGVCGDDLMLKLSPEMSRKTEVSISEPPDLTLRLSLGGIYCGKSKENSLARSSSVIGVISQNAETWKWDMQRQTGSFLSLARSCSLPAETDQLGRIKLKELQLMRRMEAKKRLVEQRGGRAPATEDEKSAAAPPSPSEVAAWAAASAAKSPALCRAIDKIKSSQGSLSQNQSYTIEGHGSVGSTKGSSSSQSSLESNDREPVVNSQTLASRKTEKPPTNAAKRAKIYKGLMEGDRGMDVMRTMPSVSTIGDGPNGRKVEGFLYKYMKGQVCIVCVCHGSFLTPAEFVKHAGGKEVANPMKHIHVCCTSFSLENERKHQEQ